MRIVYLANSRWPSIRGAERLLLGLAKRGASTGHEAVVVAPQASAIHGACADAGIRTETAEFTLQPAELRRTRAMLHRLRPQIVHGMSIFPVAYVRRLCLAPPGVGGWFAHVSIDPTSHLPIATTHFRRTLLFVRNRISRREAPRLDAIFAVAETVAEHLSDAGIRGRIVVLTGVVDPDALAADAAAPITLPEGRPRIGYAGYLEPLKGVGDLVTAFADIVAEYPEAVLLVAGEGPERGRLLDLAASLGVADRVHLLGFVDPVAPLFARLDVFVSASHSEALSRSILEAMTLGVPCVCTDSGGTSDAVRDGDNGLLVPARDPGAISRAVLGLLGDPERSSRLARNGRASVLNGPYLLSATLDAVYAEYELAAARATG